MADVPDDYFIDQFKHQTDINWQSATNTNLLMEYLESANPISVAAVKTILDAGIDISQKDIEWDTAINFAARNPTCPYEVFKMLIDAGSDVNNVKNKSRGCMHYYLDTVDEADPAIVKLFLDYGFNFELLNEEEREKIKDFI